MKHHRKGTPPPPHYRRLELLVVGGVIWTFWLRPPDHKGMATVKLVAATDPGGKANYWAMYLSNKLVPWGTCLALPAENPGLWAAAQRFVRGEQFLATLAELRDGELPPRQPRRPGTVPSPRFALSGTLPGGWRVYFDQEAPDPTHWANILLWGPEYSYRLGWCLADQFIVRRAQSRDLDRRHPDVAADLIRYLRGLRHG